MMAVNLVDLHCHLDLYEDFLHVVRDCDAKRIYTLAVTTTPRAWPRNHELAGSTRHVRAALGLHPQLVAKEVGAIELFERYLPQARFVGEVGLDAGPRHFRSLGLQNEVFERILRECARAGGKILSVHSVRSASAVLDLIEKHLPADRGRVVLHWWTGSRSEARRAVRLGCFFSVNFQMLRTSSQQELLADIPLDRIVTETDGPFTRFGPRAAWPSDVALTARRLASIRGIDASVMLEAITSNYRALVSES